MASLAPVAEPSRTSGWRAKTAVSTRRIAGPAPSRPSSRCMSATEQAPHSAETRHPASALDASAGHSGVARSSGMAASEGSGFHTKPMAARCGSRLNRT